MVGLRADRLAIDRKVAKIKVSIGIGAILTLAVIGFDIFLGLGT